MLATPAIRPDATRQLTRLLAIVVAMIVIALLYFAKVVFLPLGFAVLFSFLLAPLVTLLQRIRLPRVLSVLVVILGAAVLLSFAGWTIATQLIDVTAQLPVYRLNINAKLGVFSHPGDTTLHRAQEAVGQLSKQLDAANSSSSAGNGPGGNGATDGSAAQPVAVKNVTPSGGLAYLGGAVEPLVTAFLTVVFTFFMLIEREDLRNRMIRLTGNSHLNRMTRAMDDASHRISRYFQLQFLVNAVYGVVIFVALHFIGLPHAVLFGALATGLRFIPYIGAPIAALLPTALSLAVFHGWSHSLLILGIFFCLEVGTANYLEPRLYGRHTGLSSLAILVAASFWTLIWGPVGLVLSVPLTVCLVVVGMHVPNLEFLTVLLGDQPVMEPPAHYYQRLLAGDEREAGEVVENYLKEHTLIELYDEVLIPALILSEQDRHRKNLDEEAVRFIHQSTRDIIEDLALHPVEESRRERISSGGLEDGQQDQGERADGLGSVSLSEQPTCSTKVLCVAVRDEADELVAVMLAQLLERAGCETRAIPLSGAGELFSASPEERPDAVFLSGLPPFALAGARRTYRRVRREAPHLRILIGLWNHPEDGAKAAAEVSRSEEDHIATSLEEAVAQVGALDQYAPSRPSPVRMEPAAAAL